MQKDMRLAGSIPFNFDLLPDEAVPAIVSERFQQSLFRRETGSIMPGGIALSFTVLDLTGGEERRSQPPPVSSQVIFHAGDIEDIVADADNHDLIIIDLVASDRAVQIHVQ